MKQSLPRAVIFDMDGLMFDSERLILRAWSRAMADFGYPASEDVYLRSVGLTMEKTNEMLRAAFGPDFPLDPTNERTDEYVWQEVAERGVPFKPGLPGLLAYLDSQRIPCAVASSSSRSTVDRLLTAAGLLNEFAATVAGDEVQYGKPAPDIFLSAARLVNIAPKACLVLEDSEAGARAAFAAGIPCIIVPDLRPPSSEVAALAAAVLPDLHAVRDWLQTGPAVLHPHESRA